MLRDRGICRRNDRDDSDVGRSEDRSISYSNRSAAVITEAIGVDSKPFNSILPFEVKYSSVTCACINKLHCKACLLFVLKLFV